MGKKLTITDIIKNCKKVHGNKYDYSKTEFLKSENKIIITCPKHGEFKQRYQDHLKGCGCSQCSGTAKLNTEIFIKKALIIHNNKYDYSKTIYKNTESKIIIKCPKHGEFNQTPHSHLSGQGCIECGKNKTAKFHRHTHEMFMKKANDIHKFKYEYFENYSNQLKKIHIICKEHGEFLQRPKDHLCGNGCPECGKRYKGKIKTKLEFINIVNEIHDFKYDYSSLEFRYMIDKCIIVCPIHGEFKQNLTSHLNGSGCNMCKSSKGEKEIIKFLRDNNIKFIPQKYFENCKYERVLYFDFYLPEFNICIEYDGEQHFKINKFFGGEATFEKIKIRDKIKEEFCKKNSIKLFRIKFDDKLIEKITDLFCN